MWTRKELKEKGKVAFKAHYWLSVFAALIIAIVGGAAQSSGADGANDATDTMDSLNELTGGYAAVVFAIILAVVAAVIIIALLKIAIGNTLSVGAHKVFINNESADGPTLSDIGSGFAKGKWVNTAVVMFLRDLFTGLWTLLFIIPGIVKAYEYRMIPYLLAEDPSMSSKEAFAKSKEMMKGQKWNAFLLDLSFIGWFILSALTFGILLVFYVNPYYQQTCTELYLTLKED